MKSIWSFLFYIILAAVWKSRGYVDEPNTQVSAYLPGLESKIVGFVLFAVHLHPSFYIIVIPRAHNNISFLFYEIV